MKWAHHYQLNIGFIHAPVCSIANLSAESNGLSGDITLSVQMKRRYYWPRLAAKTAQCLLIGRLKTLLKDHRWKDCISIISREITKPEKISIM